MKPSKEIIGLKIISIEDGTQVGYVKDYVINPQEGSLDYFIVDQPSSYLGAKIIPFTDIVGLGQFGITIPNPNVILDVVHSAPAQELLKQDVRVIGTQVLTKKGGLIGEVTELEFDEETSKIARCLFVSAKGELSVIDAKDVITYGKDLLIIESAPGAGSSKLEQKIEVKDVQSFLESKPEKEEGNEEAEFNLFEQKQLQYFLHKTVDQDITLDTGDILQAGQPITEDLLAKISTRATLMDITSHLIKA